MVVSKKKQILANRVQKPKATPFEHFYAEALKAFVFVSFFVFAVP